MPYRPLAISAVLAAAAAAVEPVALEAVPAPALRQGIAALPSMAQERALKTLAQHPAALAQAEHLQVSPSGGLCFTNCYLHAHAAAAAPAPAVRAVARAPIPVASVPAYSSRPGSANIIYLDFNGHTVAGTQWNISYSTASWTARPFSTDGDYTTFTDAEQEQILLIWQRVAEDYRTFDVNITTVEPGSFGTRTGRCLITDGTDANGVVCPAGTSAGGIAYLSVFGTATFQTYQPAWVYVDMLAKREDYTAEAASHEIGHNMGLSHDGRTTPTEAYYSGHGPAAFDWGPLMGTGYNRTMSQWSRGEYASANNTEDDLAIIAGKLTALPDDYGSSVALSSELPVTASGATQTIDTFSGLINDGADADVFHFTANSGSISIDVRPFQVTPSITSPVTPGPNLDVQIDVLDGTGTPVAGLSAAPADDINASISGTIPSAGNYYLRIQSSGNRDVLTDGYSTYGSIGRYTVSGSLPAGGPGTLGFAITTTIDDEGSLGMRTVSMVIARSAGAVGATSVDWATADGTATAGSDYTATSGSLNWADGDTSSRTISVTVEGDTVDESDEWFYVQLSNETGGVIMANTQATIVLRNDDTASTGDSAADLLKPNGTGDSGGCGAGTAVGLLGIGGLALALRRRRR